ncbi:hypothetical protein J4221_03095 [Candidatus Pacearchaeota archaeon]|nr:hypothetical protein [Candidatus Pacearchaeota archaeon]
MKRAMKKENDNFLKNYKNLILTMILSIIIISYFLFEEIGLNSLILSLVIVIGFYTVEKYFSLNFQIHHYFYILIIVFSIVFFYYFQLQFTYVDKILHLIGGFMLASVSYYIFKKKKLNYPLITAFIFSLSIILAYEFYEYIMDYYFEIPMRGVYQNINNQIIMLIDPVKDTIQDITLGITGFFLFIIKNVLKNKN